MCQASEMSTFLFLCFIKQLNLVKALFIVFNNPSDFSVVDRLRFYADPDPDPTENSPLIMFSLHTMTSEGF
jgi:hypothetical protein